MSIVLMHNIIAHDHHNDIELDDHIEQHNEASSILDFLLLGFHVDNLDQQSNETHDQPHLITEFNAIVPPAIAYSLPIKVEDYLEPAIFFYKHQFFDDLSDNDLGKRGPPAIV